MTCNFVRLQRADDSYLVIRLDTGGLNIFHHILKAVPEAAWNMVIMTRLMSESIEKRLSFLDFRRNDEFFLMLMAFGFKSH